MNIKKINLIVGREFAIRVRKKSFLIATFLTPLLMAALITVPTLMTTLKDNNEKNIEVIDPTGIGEKVLEDQEYTHFTFRREGNPEDYKKDFDTRNLHALCVIEPVEENSVEVRMYSTGPVDQDIQRYISRQISYEVEQQRLQSYNIPRLKEIMDDVRTDIPVKSLTWTEAGDEKETITEVYMAIAYLSSFLIYMFIFMYGSMVIRGVIEEKTNRIVEVIISSVKPVRTCIGENHRRSSCCFASVFLWILLTAIILFVVMALVGAGAISDMAGSAPQIQGGLAEQ